MVWVSRYGLNTTNNWITAKRRNGWDETGCVIPSPGHYALNIPDGYTRYITWEAAGKIRILSWILSCRRLFAFFKDYNKISIAWYALRAEDTDIDFSRSREAVWVPLTFCALFSGHRLSPCCNLGTFRSGGKENTMKQLWLCYLAKYPWSPRFGPLANQISI